MKQLIIINHQNRKEKPLQCKLGQVDGIKHRNTPTKRRRNGSATKLKHLVWKKTGHCEPAIATWLNVKDIWKHTALMNQTVTWWSNLEQKNTFMKNNMSRKATSMRIWLWTATSPQWAMKGYLYIYIFIYIYISVYMYVNLYMCKGHIAWIYLPIFFPIRER